MKLTYFKGLLILIALGLLHCSTDDEPPENMVMIPQGKFLMGSDNGQPNEKPVHEVSISAFYLDQNEVSTAQYAQCIAEGACSVPTVNGVRCNYEVQEKKPRSGKANHPINCVTYAQAQKYCAWQDKRLPSEQEWEYAARGPKSSTYPWGNRAPVEYEVCGALKNGTCAINEYPDQQTILGRRIDPTKGERGLFNLAGNVWEWTATAYKDKNQMTIPYDAKPIPCKDAYLCSVRGGAIDVFSIDFLRSGYRVGAEPNVAQDNIGFRCARSASQQ